ncbi:MAG: tetratricopeptide repeat protein [Caldilinea sp. CFX5]|nr:tetratricopeptide repeat protein [Caldilinea sp. CFX5]
MAATTGTGNMMALIEPTRTPLLGNRYHLYERLGAGGMGVVYRAQDRLTGETVALKRVAGQGLSAADDPALRLALAHEFQALAGLRHPNIIGVRDYGFAGNGQPYFTMDLLYNPRTLVAAGQLLATEAKVQLLLPVLHALAYLHRRGIIHRDLKPGNILVSGQTVRVLDFGLATLSGQIAPPSGTLRYMAPEVLRGGQATPASDLYAVGVIAYELFAGWHPFAPTGQSVSIERLISVEPDWEYLDLEPALLAVLQRLLAKEPMARYPDAATVIAALGEATGQSLPVETVATRESFLQAAPFIGRDGELAQMTTALAQAAAGQGSAWLIGGESGVGKSRLLSELRTRALVRGALVVRSQASSTGGAPYQLWPEVVRWLLLLTEPTDLEAAVLKPLLSTIDEFLERPVADAPVLDAKLAQSRLFSTVAALLQRAAAQQPLLLLLEDLHWADENSLALLQWLNRLVQEPDKGQTALLIVATYRRGEAPKLPEQLPTMQSLRLRRLQPTQIETLSVAMLGDHGRRAQLVEFLQHETEGNTFFVVEVLRALAEEAGQLDRVAAMTLPKQIFPGGVQQVVQRRLQRAPAAYQPLLQWAAVAGRQLDLAVLRAVDDTTDLDAWLDVCANAMILEMQEGRWQFSHDKLREGLLQTVPPAAQRYYHHQLGLAIERVHAEQLTPHYANLAYHFGQAGETTQERTYLRLAAEAAQAAYANSAAINYYERLLAVTDDVYTLADLLLRLGDVLHFVGRWAEAEQHYRRLLTLHEGQDFTSDAQGQALLARCHHAMGVLKRNRGDFNGAHEWLRQAQTSFAALPDLSRLGEVLSEIGNVYYLQGAQREGRRYLEEGLTVVRQAGNRAAEAAALHRLGSVYYSSGNYGEARTYATQALALYEALGNKVGMANAHNNLANIERSVGDYATAQTRRRTTLHLRQEIGDKWGIAASFNNLAVIPYLQGDYETAQRYWQQSLTLRNELGDRWGAGQTLDNLGLVAFSQGDYATARQLHEQSLDLRRSVGDRWGLATSLSNLAHAELYVGAIAEAQRHYQESMALSLELDDKRGLISCAIGLAGVIVAAASPDDTAFDRAVTLLSVARRLTEQIGAALERDEEILYARTVAALQQRPATVRYAAAWTEGQSMTAEALHTFLAGNQ